MNRANALGLCIGRELQVHPRIVDGQHRIGTPLINRPLHRPFNTKKIEDFLQNRHKSHDREVSHLEAVVFIAPYLVRRHQRLQTIGIKDARFLAS